MADKMDIYYFSPTGGTKKVSSIFAAALGRDVVWHDLGSKQTISEEPQGELTVVAAPVFGGRIPSIVRDKIKKLDGKGKKAVTIAVYGNRAYEDALLELKSISDVKEESFAIRDTILGKMAALRAVADEAETQTSEKYWPFPTYGELLFGVR